MAKIIIVTGCLAALKSTIAQRLSRDLGILCLTKDSIKEVLGDTIGFSDRQDNLKLSQATFQLMKYFVIQQVLIDSNTIIESNFRLAELSQLAEVFSQLPGSVLTLYLTGQPEILYQRYCERYPTRHEVHNSTGILDYQTFADNFSNHSPDESLGRLVEIDTTVFEVEHYQAVKLLVEAFLNEGTS